MGANNPLRKLYRAQTGQVTELAITGRASDGRVYVVGDSSKVYVRRQASNGLFTREAEVRASTQTPLNLEANTNVRLGYDYDGELAILGLDFSATVAKGGSPVSIVSGTNRDAAKYINTNRITPGVCRAVEGTLKVGVGPLFYLYNDNVYYISGQVDLTADKPASGSHRLVLVYIDTSDTLQTSTSTAQLVDEPFDDAGLSDLQECVTGATNLLMPLWYWYLTGDTTSLTNGQWPDGNDYLDARPIVSGGSVGGTNADYSSQFLSWRGSIF